LATTKTAPKEKIIEDEGETLNDQPVLDIDTLTPPRPFVRIKTPDNRDGELYEMLTPDELGVEEEQQLKSELREYSRLMESDKLNKAQRQRLVTVLDQLVTEMLPGAPAEVRALLSDRKRQKVVAHFTGALFAEDNQSIAAALGSREFQQLMAQMEARENSSTMES
jgi:hypothetical protein